ncbi:MULTISPECIES: hypothetical protein [unclassified Roseateles]|uniref:hypothetical protein n=1 Tax=unclassified Roseateles TaxID=2626991 RepID=UPI000701B5B6|nr:MULTISPECIES: hypothetical protein [unclassified Roseateles]KQW51138.1 hypothetical protein ASC81_00285 [Pelomonas sp. Root405]KRA77370.1 hypothetical protein ASD88_00285 [Pelomonas sp. Root662]
MSNHDNDTPAWLLPARVAFNRRQPGADQDAALLAQLTEQQRVQRIRRTVAETAEAHEPRWLRRLAWGSGALGATAAVLLSAVLLLDPPGTQTARAAPATGSGFIPLVPESEFRAALAASRSAAVWLQPAELPRERLALLGLPFDAARADETVRAELMLNPSGQLLAVRILN